jgi:hypothetical protein
MTDREPPKPPSDPARSRRLGAALRENLKRRKAQAKGRALEAADEATESPQAPNSAGFSGDKRSGNA